MELVMWNGPEWVMELVKRGHMMNRGIYTNHISKEQSSVYKPQATVTMVLTTTVLLYIATLQENRKANLYQNSGTVD